MGNLTKRTVRDKVWKRTGLSESELTQPVIEEAIDSAMIEFSKHRERILSGTMPIQSGVVDYAFPTAGSPPTVLLDDVTDFFYSNSETFIGDFSFEDLLLMSIQGGMFSINFGGNIFENPSLVNIWYTKLAAFRDTIGLPDWSIVQGNPMTIRLGTTPTQDGTAYFQGRGQWTLDLILPSDEEVFMKAVMWKVAEGRVMKISVVDDYYEYGGIRIRPATDFWDKKEKEYKEDFLKDVGFYRGVIAIG
jgi:hypothetical protein